MARIGLWVVVTEHANPEQRKDFQAETKRTYSIQENVWLACEDALKDPRVISFRVYKPRRNQNAT